MARATRNSTRMAQLDDDDDLVLRLSQSQISQRDGQAVDDDLTLYLSQTQNTQLDESAVSDLASSTTNILVNIARIEQVIKQNQGVFSKQHDVLLNLVSDISVNVAEISDRVNKIEKKQCNMQKILSNHKDVLDAVVTDLEKVKKSARIVTQKHSRSINHDQFEERLKIVETKLKKHELKSAVSAPVNNATEEVFIIRNLPYGMRDEDDVQQLIREGLDLNIKINSIHRAPSINHEAGVLTIKVASQDEKLKIITNKWKLSNSDKYYNVYIDEGETPINRRIERKFKMMINNLHDRRAAPTMAYNRTYHNRNRYRQ